MKGHILSPVVDRSPVLRNSPAKNHHPKPALLNHGNPNFGDITAISASAVQENAPLSNLWVSKIGDRVVGMARLVQNGPHSAEIVCFRVDPEWIHTKIPMHLINSIQTYCRANGKHKVTLNHHIVPFWMQTLLSHHGFRCK
jgi:N-acetylglutamate synthase-like GNAT family acetyltransferase